MSMTMYWLMGCEAFKDHGREHFVLKSVKDIRV